MCRLPRLPLTIFERTGVFGRQSLARDHLTYFDVATDRQQRAYDIVRRTMPSQFLAWNVATQPSPTHCVRSPNSLLVAVFGCITRLPQFAKA